MIIVSNNLSQGEALIHDGEELPTGYIKRSTPRSIELKKQGVVGDVVVDKRVHGGQDKACYVYGLNHYSFWQRAYPELSMNHGFFGENLTLESVEESELCIGNTYQLGSSIVQISQPRQPCLKLGLRFGDMKAIKSFREAERCGVYLRVLQEGRVSPGDGMDLLEKRSELSVQKVFHLLFHGGTEWDYEKALACSWLPESCAKDLRKKMGQ